MVYTNKTIAIICASGIGDGLLMQIAAHYLQRLGHNTVTFSNPLTGPFSSWFPGFCVAKQPALEQIQSTLAPFDAIVLQHDNSDKARAIHALAKPVYTLYGSHLPSKHGPLRPSFDAVFDPSLCMAENIARRVHALFPDAPQTRANGLVAPQGLTFGKYPKRVAIHPTSTSVDKNWSRRSFLRLYERLANEGWEPRFIAPPEEATAWNAPLFPTLADLAAFLYESGGFIGNDSGPGHLASNVGLATVTIGPSERHLDFWRPGWQRGVVIHPPRWVSGLNVMRTKWPIFISVNQVFELFMKLNALK